MKRSMVWCLTLFISGNVLSEDTFTLFDPERGTPPPAPPVAAPKVQTPPSNPFKARQPEPPPPPKALLPQKDFALRGTSRMGDKRYAILQAPDGKEFVQKLTDNKRTPLDGYAEYALLGVAGREIVLEYPSTSPCRTSDPAKGLKCSMDQKTATLSLVTLNAIAAPPPPLPPPLVPPVQPPGQQANPFMSNPASRQQQDEEERKRRAEIYKNFKRQVIKDEDVPPGMRVIRTPFGDRLVPDNRQ